mmetsp:Transcript_46687/g.111029  ORF Transcript_46687/g.111029 Transcript_46687/m.111029 type:complete len:327 (-) Transcript_46687:51-1031(-)
MLLLLVSWRSMQWRPSLLPLASPALPPCDAVLPRLSAWLPPWLPIRLAPAALSHQQCAEVQRLGSHLQLWLATPARASPALVAAGAASQAALDACALAPPGTRASPALASQLPPPPSSLCDASLPLLSRLFASSSLGWPQPPSEPQALSFHSRTSLLSPRQQLQARAHLLASLPLATHHFAASPSNSRPSSTNCLSSSASRFANEMSGSNANLGLSKHLQPRLRPPEPLSRRSPVPPLWTFAQLPQLLCAPAAPLLDKACSALRMLAHLWFRPLATPLSISLSSRIQQQLLPSPPPTEAAHPLANHRQGHSASRQCLTLTSASRQA